MAEPAPPRRRDAERNRRRLIDAALRTLTDADGPVPLEAVARAAGVGIGTLYRHFPSREALIEAVYRNELAQVCDQAAALLATLPPDRALRAWMARYADFVATKRGMADALREVLVSGAVTRTDTRERLGGAAATLLAAGARAGTLRADVDPEDVVAAMAGVLLTAVDPAQAGRLLDLVLDALRT